MTIRRCSAVAFAAVIAFGCSSEEEQPTNVPRTVDVVQARSERIEETFRQVGEIQPYHDTALGFRLGGVLEVRRSLGQAFEEGDVLATLDTRPAETDLRAARAELAAANAAMALAELAAGRQRTLLERNATAQATLDEANANLATTEARVDAAAVAVEQAEDALRYTELLAPHEGTISAVQANEGEVVAAGQTVLRLVTEERRHAVFDVPEVLYRTTPDDATIALQLVTDPSIAASGTIDEVAPLADQSTRAYRVKIAVDGNAEAMPFGAAVLGTLVLGSDVLMRLPASALTTSNGGTAVFAVDPQTGTAHRKPVEVLRFDERFLYVSAGLNEGESIATTGVSKLRDGERVLVREEAR